MTVEVCLLKAGTTNAALLDILCGSCRIPMVEVGIVESEGVGCLGRMTMSGTMPLLLSLLHHSG